MVGVRTNVASLDTQRLLGATYRGLALRMGRLSSGLRVRSAEDDPVGFSVGERLTSQIRGLGQSIRNANGGLSVADVAEGALQESSSILQRMRELAVQAASDTNSEADRRVMQDEVGALIAELDRIAGTTDLNTQRLLDGSFTEATFHVGARSGEIVRLSLPDMRPARLGEWATQIGLAVSTQAIAGGDLTINGVQVRSTQPGDDPLSTTLAAASAISKAAAINAGTASHGVTARVRPTELIGGSPVAGGRLDDPSSLVINGELIAGVDVRADDGGGGLVDVINRVADRTGVVAHVDARLRLVLTADDGRNIQVSFTGEGAAIAGLQGLGGEIVQTGRVDLSGPTSFQLGGADEGVVGFADNQQVAVSDAEALATLSVLDRRQASSALLRIDRAMTQVTGTRGLLAAFRNRLAATVDHLGALAEGASAARGRIRDADFAAEAAELSRLQIMSQAQVSVLAQANSAPQQIIGLLK